MDLGATGLQTFRHVLLPILGTALLAGGMLAFALSFDEIIVTTFTAGNQDTLPIWIFKQLTRPRDRPVTNVVALFVIAGADGVDGYLVGMAVGGAGFGTYMAVDIALVVDVLPDTGSAAKDLGVLNIAGALPFALAPAIAPTILAAGDGSYTLLYLVAGACAAAGAGKTDRAQFPAPGSVQPHPCQRGESRFAAQRDDFDRKLCFSRAHCWMRKVPRP